MADLALDTGRSAVLSPCGRYRYSLGRRWGDGDALVWCMLNPSTADADTDDPTLRRVIGFTRAAGYRALTVVNLFALRATDPREIVAAEADIRRDAVGPENNRTLLAAMEASRVVVAAWGAHAAAKARQHVALAYAVAAEARVLCLGRTKTGEPRHPLYVRGDQPLVEYRP